MREIDFHTHRFKSNVFIQILNVFAQDLPVPDDGNFYSTGLHPWHIGLGNGDKGLHSIELAATHKNMLAVGECGLDRSIATDFTVQEHYFRQQIAIAEKHSKPLVVHCVRAFPELMKLKKETKSSVPWIIHGFRGNGETARQLIGQDFYFSIGQTLLNDSLKKEILSLFPTRRLFFETDDGPTPIIKIYTLASQILNTDTEELRGIIFENFSRLFGDKNVGNNYLT